MERPSLADAYVSFKAWLASYKKRHGITSMFSVLYSRLFTRSTGHFTPLKVLKGLVGFVPVALLAHYVGYKAANKVDFNQFIEYLESEEQIYWLVEQGWPVMTFMYLPGEIFSETMHPHFHKAAQKHYK